jgi:hypothetical protein
MADKPPFDLKPHMARLRMWPVRPATEPELARMERLSGTALPPSFRTFLSVAGGARCNCVLADGPAKGRDVIFFESAEILSRLEELPGKKIVPFADDLMGNVYFLTSAGVKQFDDADETFVDVAPSFEALLETLKVRE